MKERALELIEELVGAHNYGAKRNKADELAALVKTAVFPADQVDELDAEPAKLEPEPTSLGPVSGVFTSGNVFQMPQQVAESLASSEQAQMPAGDTPADNAASDRQD